MEELKEQVERILKRAKESNIPILITYGNDKTYLAEFGTMNEGTPDRIRRARTAFVSAPSTNKSVMEFD